MKKVGDFMNLFEAFGVITLKDEGLKKGLASATSSLAGFGGKVVGGVTNFTNSVLKGMAIGGAAVAGFGVGVIKVGAEFESGMAQVAATMGITADKSDADFARLSKAAKDAGANTKFSAAEASEALNYLALAGYETTQAVETMPKVLTLAAAGGLELGYASDMVTDSMATLGLEINQADMFIDQMAKTSQKSNTSVGQLGEAILTVGGTAKGMAGGTAELNTVLGVLADNGTKGSEAGISLRNILRTLGAPTDAVKQELDKLGVSAYDLDGNLRPLPDIMGDMNAGLSGMTEEQKMGIINKIFNPRDLKSVNDLLATTPERWDTLSEAIENSDGTAQDMADTMQNTLAGSFTKLKSMLSVFAIDIYENFSSPLSGAIDVVTDFVGDFRVSMEGISESIQSGAISSQDGFKMMANVFGEGLSGLITKMLDKVPAMIETAGSFVTGFIEGITKNIDSIGQTASNIIETFFNTLKDIFPKLVPLGVQIIMILLEAMIAKYEFIFTAGVELITKLIQGVAEKLPDLIPKAVEAIQNIVDGLIQNLPLVIEAAVKIVEALLNGLVDALPAIIEGARAIIENLVNAIVQLLPLIISVGLPLLLELIKGIAQSLPVIIPQLVDVIMQIIKIFLDNINLIIEVGLSIVLALIDGLIQSIPVLIAAIPQIVMAIISALIGYIPLILTAGIQLFMTLVRSLATAGIQLISKLGSVIMDAINFIVGKVAEMGAAALNFFMSIPQSIGKMLGSLGSALASIWSNISSAVSSWLGQLASLAVNLWNKIPEGIRGMLGNLGSAIASIWNSISSGITGMVGKMLGLGKDLIKGLIDGISSMAGAVWDKIKSIANGVIDTVKSIFSIFSPSRVMEDLGKFVPMGFNVGIEGQRAAVEKTTEETFGAVFDVVDELENLGSGMGIDIPTLTFDDITNGKNAEPRTQIIQNIYTLPQNPAELMAEARRQQEMAVLSRNV